MFDDGETDPLDPDTDGDCVWDAEDEAPLDADVPADPVCTDRTDTDMDGLPDAEDRAHGHQRQPFIAPQKIETQRTLIVPNHVRQRIFQRGRQPLETLILRLRLIESTQILQ